MVSSTYNQRLIFKKVEQLTTAHLDFKVSRVTGPIRELQSFPLTKRIRMMENTWKLRLNLNIIHLEWKNIFQTSIVGFKMLIFPDAL